MELGRVAWGSVHGSCNRPVFRPTVLGVFIMGTSNDLLILTCWDGGGAHGLCGDTQPT